MIQDAQGHHLLGATEAAVTAYDQAVRAFNLRGRALSTNALAWVIGPGSVARANTQAFPRYAIAKSGAA